MAFFYRSVLASARSGRARERGVTLIELLISIVVLAILVAIAIPSFSHFIERNRLAGAAQTAYGELQRVRAEAIKRNEPVYLYAQGGGADWCFAVADETLKTSDCNCDGSGGDPVCSLDGVEFITKASDFPDVTMTRTDEYLGFDPDLGMTDAPAEGNMMFTKSDMNLKVSFSKLGRVRICYRNDAGDEAVSGFEACP